MLASPSTLFKLSLALAIMLGASGTAWADPPAKKSDSDLTEGLMDLLREPANKQSPQKPGDQAGTPSKSNAPSIVPLTPQELGKLTSNPLAEVELGMSTLAGWLRGQPDASRTKELQRDVVLRLDEMIGELEKQSATQSSSSSSAGQSSSAQNQSSSNESSAARSASTSGAQSQPANQAASGDSQRQGKTGEPSNADPTAADKNQTQGPGSSRPGQSSGGNDPQSDQSLLGGVSPIRSRTVNVDLNDPRALQRSAWGNLPERMREQMQSRMVERFLPPYRDEIEAYYRALVK